LGYFTADNIKAAESASKLPVLPAGEEDAPGPALRHGLDPRAVMKQKGLMWAVPVIPKELKKG